MEVQQQFFRDTWVEVNLDHIEENIKQIKGIFKQEMNIMAVVKANAYGHGAVEVAKRAIRAGARYLAVSFLDEALQLRQAGIVSPILVFGRVRPHDVNLAAAHQIAVTVYQEEWLLEAKQHYTADQSLRLHVKFDTGMGRIGITNKENGKAVITLIQSCEMFELEGVFTHFATADDTDLDYFNKQYSRFLDVLAWLEDWGVSVKFIHCGNSATGLRFPDKVFNMVRLGIAMYGLSPSEEIKEEIPVNLKEAFSLHSRIIQVKEIHPGDAISYGATYVAAEKQWIATIPIGYADGWFRYHSSQGGYVLVDGKRAPIVGRVCMDQCMVRLPYEVEVGTVATLIGSQQDERITVDQVAKRLETINYEIPCMIGSRVPRIFIEEQKIIAIRNGIRL
ncbi:alanine racemase [Desertibacillus haloalkaliphilus]|uniref:alanine racemase n=1 Tax=Desertibacillus haloalkaliphilus TaxID=1328930 RepID=UPI001C27A5FA|nr:alanine racemase [Desertibacillus haloalkaliphilus]MBU8908766.1 alanine racemase [Desertibacillus haloalkaliphilus]